MDGAGGSSGAAGEWGTSTGDSTNQATGGSGTSTQSTGTQNPACDDPPENCEAPGAICVDNVLIGCTLDDDGCLVEANTDCGDDICDHLREVPTCSPRGGQTADSCEEKLFLDGPDRISGGSFSADFSDRQAFTGEGCELASANAPDAMFVIDVAAGQTLSVFELEDSVGDYGIDAIFGVMAGCSNKTPCIASGGDSDRDGISYTALSDETVVVWVSTNSAWEGPYDIHIELPETLGSIGSDEELDPVEGDELSAGEWHSGVLHLEEEAVLAGTISTGYANVYVADEMGELVIDSTTLTQFAAVLQPSTYRVTVSPVVPVEGYSLSLFTRSWHELGDFSPGERYDQELPDISAGDSRFYRFSVSEPTVLDIMVDTATGDPVLWLFAGNGTFWGFSDDFGATEQYTPATLEPGSYLLQIVAYEAQGDISSHTLELDFSAP